MPEHYTGRTHSERMVCTAYTPISEAQRTTINLIEENGMHVNVWGYNPHSMALITECLDMHPIMRGTTPLFTIITPTGMTYCPYPA